MRSLIASVYFQIPLTAVGRPLFTSIVVGQNMCQGVLRPRCRDSNLRPISRAIKKAFLSKGFFYRRIDSRRRISTVRKDGNEEAL